MGTKKLFVTSTTFISWILIELAVLLLLEFNKAIITAFVFFWVLNLQKGFCKKENVFCVFLPTKVIHKIEHLIKYSIAALIKV